MSAEEFSCEFLEAVSSEQRRRRLKELSVSVSMTHLVTEIGLKLSRKYVWLINQVYSQTLAKIMSGRGFQISANEIIYGHRSPPNRPQIEQTPRKEFLMTVGTYAHVFYIHLHKIVNGNLFRRE